MTFSCYFFQGVCSLSYVVIDISTSLSLWSTDKCLAPKSGKVYKYYLFKSPGNHLSLWEFENVHQPLHQSPQCSKAALRNQYTTLIYHPPQSSILNQDCAAGECGKIGAITLKAEIPPNLLFIKVFPTLQVFNQTPGF